MSDVALLVVAVEGRADLLAQTLGSFLSEPEAVFAECVLALDGQDDGIERLAAQWGLRLVRGPREGLLGNLTRGYGALSAPLVFHLEDDWRLVGRLPLVRMRELLLAHEDVSQVRLSKYPGIREDAGVWKEVGSSWPLEQVVWDAWAWQAFHSFNPHLTRRQLWHEWVGGELPTTGGVEAEVTKWLRARGMRMAVLDPALARVEHLGGQETMTERRFHMMAPPARRSPLCGGCGDLGGNIPYGSHVAILAACVAHSAGPVLEYGVGYFSSPMLHMMCAPSSRELAGRPVVSVEHRPEWLAKFKCLGTPWHILCSPEEFALRTDEHWSVVFVDEDPVQDRAEKIEWARKRADLIVVHDSEQVGWGYEATLQTFPHRRDFKFLRPWTTIVSDKPLPGWLA